MVPTSPTAGRGAKPGDRALHSPRACRAARRNPAGLDRAAGLISPPKADGTRGAAFCAASYQARRFGVRSARPSATAGRLCPRGVCVRRRMDRYKQNSGFILHIMGETGAGIEPMSIVPRKGISGEETFLHDREDRGVLWACLREQAAEIAAKLKRRHLAAHTVHVKVRHGDFTTPTCQRTVEEPIIEAKDIYRLGCYLLARRRLVLRPLRLLGLGVSNLREPTARQFILL